jgi:putative sterol carrier protein
MTTLKEIFEKMPLAFDAGAARGLKVVIQFVLTGEGGGDWHVDLDEGMIAVVEGKHPTPKLTISATAQDYVNISTGKLNEQLAFMTGRITARGDTLLAMKLPKIFKR